MATAWCLSCDGELSLGPKPKVGQFFTCQICRSVFELVWLDPIELDWPYDDYEEDDETLYEYEDDYDVKAYEDMEDY
jgi:hypothetical protein